MTLTEPFAFIDRNDRPWRVPSGSPIDGESIPRPLWVITNPPFVGKARRASVVHDYFCYLEPDWTTSRDVHEMFFNALRVSGVRPVVAKAKFAAVTWFGPKWPMPSASQYEASEFMGSTWGYSSPGEETKDVALLAAEAEKKAAEETTQQQDRKHVLPRAEPTEEELQRFKEWVESDSFESMSVDEIAEYVETRFQGR